MRKISTARSSRRAPTLKVSDYDHEINLVDRVAEAATPRPLSTEPPGTPKRTDNALTSPQAPETPNDQTLPTYTTAVSAIADSQPGPSQRRDRPSSPVDVSRGRVGSAKASLRSQKSKSSREPSSARRSLREGAVVPRVEVNGPTPSYEPSQTAPKDHPRGRDTPETAFDVLYENQRGGFLCGIPLFSPKALGQLDPPAWTNVAHKPSPTNIYTAQVPDPSWVWVWDEWHVNRDVGVDEDGWEYSFMFSKTFSWHSSKWYNSFVRRRAWIRKRMRKDPGSNDPHMPNTEYFSVRPSIDTVRTGSKAGSRHSRASMSISSWALEKTDIEDIETLMSTLSRARIDREKIEVVESFLEHGEEELVHLQHKMHDIMASFVFQASRRVLLSRLNRLFDATQEELRDNDTGRLQRRSNNLRAAIRHADEEIQTLEYWSDVRKLVKEGDTNAATDKCQGWDQSWRGVDNSGPVMPNLSRCNV